MTSETAPSGMTIRRAHDGEMRAIRMLLPETFSATQAPYAYVAIDSVDGLAGAVAIAWAPGGFPVDVHVVPRFRRRGIGRALIEAVSAAAAGETARLRSWGLVNEGGEAESFLRATGFVPAQRVLGFETDGVRLVEVTGAIRQRLERAGKIPSTMRLVPLSEAPRAEVIGLVLSEVAVVPATLAARIAAQGGAGYDNDLSVVLMVDGKVGAAALMTRTGDIVRLEVTVVAPSLRRGWANALLLGEATRRGIASGAKRCRFFCDEHIRETINAARRIAATPLGAVLSLERRLLPPEGAQPGDT